MRRKGIYSATRNEYGFVKDSETGQSYFVAPYGAEALLDGDEVSFDIVTDYNGERASSINVVRHNTTVITGVAKKIGGRIYISPDSDRIHCHALVERGDAEEGKRYALKITEYYHASDDEGLKGEIIDEFGAADDVDSLIAAMIYSSGVKDEFPVSCLDEAMDAASAYVDPAGRLDLRDRLIFTCDGDDSKDFDDAVSIEKTDDGYLLGVHIADVSEYVKEGSPNDISAAGRGFSVYLPKTVIPMLPEDLSNGICSLNPGEDRYALSCFVRFDEYGEITGYEIKKTIINSKIRGVYSEINDVIKRGKVSPFHDKYIPILNYALPNMLKLYKILEKRESDRGGVELKTTDTKIYFDSEGYVEGIEPVRRGPAEKMIEQFMISANTAVAMWMEKNRLPAIYRVHGKPPFEKTVNLRVFAYNLGLSFPTPPGQGISSRDLNDLLLQAEKKDCYGIFVNLALRSMEKAKYSDENKGHFGLALERYCHFTSPIRRYADLVVHRIIKEKIEGKMSDERKSDFRSLLPSVCDRINKAENVTADLERSVISVYKCEYMKRHIGQIIKVRISSVQRSGFFAQTEDYCEGFVPVESLRGYFEYNEKTMTLRSSSKVYKIGDTVNVRVIYADPVRSRVEMRLAPR